MWRMPRFPILDRSREWKGDVMPTNAIAESGALSGQVSRWGFDIQAVEDWERVYRKECFYRGLRVLLELERDGQ